MAKKKIYQELKVGKWVRWKTAEGLLMTGHVVGEAGLNRANEYVYPIELLNGNRTAVKREKLEIIPSLKAGVISQKRKNELIAQCDNYNKNVKTMGKKDNNGGDIDLNALVSAREKEIEDLRGKLDEANRQLVLKTQEAQKLSAKVETLEKDIETLKNNPDVLLLSNRIYETADKLQKIVEQLLNDVSEANNSIALDLLPIIYSLITFKR